MTTLLPETICEKCGKIHKTYWGTPSCRAHRQGIRPLTPCTKAPKNGMQVCRTHGAAGIAKAEERLSLMQAEGEIAQLMREVDLPDQHPVDGLLEVVRVSGAMMRLLTIKVGELSEDTEIREILHVNKKTGDVKIRYDTDEAFWGVNKDGEKVPHIYVQLLRTWSERYERACKTALDAGIEERRIRLAEDTADTFFGALSKALPVAGLTPAQQVALMQALAKELRVKAEIIEIPPPEDEDLI